MKNEDQKQILFDNDILYEKRNAIQKSWMKKKFYKFLSAMFRPKTTLERYGLLIVVLQLITLLCSYISYCTGHAFMEQYIAVWVSEPLTVFWVSVGFIALLEVVKILSATPLFLAAFRLQGFKWGAAVLVFLTFGFSMYISFDGAQTEVINNAKPQLVNIDSIRQYYDAQLLTMNTQKKDFLTNPTYKNSKGKVLIKTLENQVKPLTNEITRITQLRDQQVANAQGKNTGIENDHDQYVTADAATMAMIALGADIVKLLISLITAWFFVAAAKDFDIIHDEEAINKDHFGKSEFGLLEAHLKEQEQKAKDKNGNILNIKEEQPQNESKQESTVNTETSTENRDRIVLKDKHTIEHKGKFYRMNDVNAFIRTYTKRVNEALQNGKDTLAQSRSEVLDYWYSKKQELETKQQETA